ncbi:gp059 (endogenous virus) [Lactococcus phage KSY1]|jgi:hypothetical protein|uniref:Gp059 n=1 Tax=Lactococcus phage KSY1 TaxID=2913972 RepID=A6MAC4_9CAUD|nr:gp059 [Lactococcus phage KSY1]ABG21602.1 gp059 [Lactococcus phage KSY1]
MIIKKRIVTSSKYHSNNPVKQFSSNPIEADINARFLNAKNNPGSKQVALDYAHKLAKANESEHEVYETRQGNLWNDDNIDMR